MSRSIESALFNLANEPRWEIATEYPLEIAADERKQRIGPGLVQCLQGGLCDRREMRSGASLQGELQIGSGVAVYALVAFGDGEHEDTPREFLRLVRGF
jgi:hypothetical protein